jgi:YVTN family beta-propeller protein
MIIQFSSSTKFMCAGIALSLGWFVLESCKCDQNEIAHPDPWVACVGTTPVLLQYNGTDVVSVSNNANFDPSQWNCKHTGSPPQPNSGAPKLDTGTAKGPSARTPHAIGSGNAAYHPRQLLDLPFLPNVPPPATTTCDSSYADVFQVNHLNALVTRISTCPFAIKQTIPVVTRPLQVVMTPDGLTALVTSFDNALNFIDLATNKVTFTLMTDASINPDGLAISPDGNRAYITSFNTNGGVAVIDLAARKIIATIPTVAYPQSVALTPDGSQAWITSPLAASVDIYDLLSNTHVIGLAIPETTDIAFDSTGTHAYITTTSTVPGSVVQVDTSTYKILKTYTVGVGPTDIKMSYADQFLVVNNDGAGSVSVIDLLKDVVVTLNVGANPSSISFVH